MFSMCFPEEVPDYDLPMDLGYGTDEMDMIGIGCIFDVAPHGPHTVFDMFEIFVLETDEDDSILDAYTDDMDFIGIGHILDAAPRGPLSAFDIFGASHCLGVLSLSNGIPIPFSSVVPRHCARVRSLFHHFGTLRTLLQDCPDSTLFLLDPFPVLPDPSPVLARFHTFPVCRIPPFSKTHLHPSPVLGFHTFRLPDPSPTDSTIFGTCEPFSRLARIKSLIFPHRDRVSFYLCPTSCLDPIVHSVKMTYFLSLLYCWVGTKLLVIWVLH
ncbi:hypothetical protein AAG906_017177 [Vitis piasezkii]